MPPNFVLETLIKKRKFYASLMEKQVPHPHTAFLGNGDLGKNVKNMDFPVLVKPSVSQIFSIQFGRKAFIANSNQELIKYLKLTKKHGIDVMIQEIVSGPPSNNYALDGYFDRHGRLVAFFPRRVLRIWPISLGLSSACVSVSLSKVFDMKETTERYLTYIGYRGIFNAHFKVDSHDGIPKLLEVNARSVGGGGVANTFPTACGVNFILTAYLDALGENITPTSTYKTNACVLNSKNEIMWIFTMAAQRKFSLREWLSTTAGKEKHWTHWARDDVKPFVASYLALAADVVKHRDKISERARETEL